MVGVLQSLYNDAMGLYTTTTTKKGWGEENNAIVICWGEVLYCKRANPLRFNMTNFPRVIV